MSSSFEPQAVVNYRFGSSDEKEGPDICRNLNQLAIELEKAPVMDLWKEIQG